MNYSFLAAALAYGFGLTTVAQATPQHDHAAHAHITRPVPPPAQRWDAAGALRDGMDRIRTALEDLRQYQAGRMDAAAALERVGRIERAAADIFAGCRLTPERDAVLHGMLVPLLGAAHKFKADPRDMAQLDAMRTAVAGYPRYFNAPGWNKPATHAH